MHFNSFHCITSGEEENKFKRKEERASKGGGECLPQMTSGAGGYQGGRGGPRSVPQLSASGRSSGASQTGSTPGTSAPPPVLCRLSWHGAHVACAGMSVDTRID